MECSTCSWFLPSRKHSANRGSRFRRWSVWRSRNAPPSELIVPPSKRATISRLPAASNLKSDWIHSVIAKAVLSSALTVVWKLSYAMKDGLLPTTGENSGLGIGACRKVESLPDDVLPAVHLQRIARQPVRRRVAQRRDAARHVLGSRQTMMRIP